MLNLGDKLYTAIDILGFMNIAIPLTDTVQIHS